MITSTKSDVLILGGSGFLGSSVLLALRQDGWNAQGISSADCDLLDLESTRRLLTGRGSESSMVFCAAITRTQEDTASILKSNLQMVDNVARVLKNHHLKHVIFFSSADVYGQVPPLPITEETLPAPQTLYGTGKLAAEALLTQELISTPVTIFRLPGVYGTLDRQKSVIGRLTQQLQKSPSLQLQGSLTLKRDYIPVSFLSAVTRECLSKPVSQILNVATGISLSLLEWSQLVAHALGIDLRIEDSSAKSAGGAGDLVFNINKLRALYPTASIPSPQHAVFAYAESLKTLKGNSHG